MTAVQLALLTLAVQAINTFLASIQQPYRVTAEDVTLTQKGGWVMIALPIDKRNR